MFYTDDWCNTSLQNAKWYIFRLVSSNNLCALYETTAAVLYICV